MEFGDSSINLEGRVWIKDPSNGVTNIKSAILLKVWQLFKENNIEIPYPQRDLHIKTIQGANPLTTDNPNPSTATTTDQTLPK